MKNCSICGKQIDSGFYCVECKALSEAETSTFYEYYGRFKAARDFERNGRSETALEIYRSILQDYIPIGTAYYERPAIILERMGSFEEAISICQKALELITQGTLNADPSELSKRLERLKKKSNVSGMKPASSNAIAKNKATISKPASSLNSEYGHAGFIDVETTGLSSSRDEIIEFALVVFSFERSTGRIIKIVDEYCSFREPSIPISREASRVNGIYMSDVKGHRLDFSRIEIMLKRCEFLISHNVGFDRTFVEKILYTRIANKKWYCSMRGIKWKEQGCPTTKLQDLLKQYCIECGKAHRAADDCRAALKLLSQCDKDGNTFLSMLLKHGPSRQRSAPNVFTASKHIPKPYASTKHIIRLDEKEAASAKENSSCSGCIVSIIAVFFILLMLVKCS